MQNSTRFSSNDAQNCRRFDIAACIAFISLSQLLCLYHWSESGAQWPDGPRYANAGAMFHDWLLSGDYLHPYAFAMENYAQYPGFSVPYHPPVYPAVLGVFFTGVGMTYLTARIFIALCLGACGCICYAIQRHFAVSRIAAFVSSVLFLTLPEVVHWSRDTMSEVPALAFLLAGTLAFLYFLRNERRRCCWLAFALATLAFLSKFGTCGILPGWFLVLILNGKARLLRSRTLIVAAVLYLAISGVYVYWATRFGQYESAADGRAEGLSWKNLTYFTTGAPGSAPWGIAVAALVGAVLGWRQNGNCPATQFWFCWLMSYSVFKLFIATTTEPRHFFFALPALAGLTASLVSTSRALAAALWLLSLVTNVVGFAGIPPGVVGYDAVARTLAATEKPGNLLFACRHDQDLIFRYRAEKPAVSRRVVRADRTLAVRNFVFTIVDPKVLAQTREDVIALLRRGRVRYVVSVDVTDSTRDDRLTEEKLVHEAAKSTPSHFRLLGEFPLLMQFGPRVRRDVVHVWEHLGELPDGPSEIPVRIPTAGMEIQK